MQKTKRYFFGLLFIMAVAFFACEDASDEIAPSLEDEAANVDENNAEVSYGVTEFSDI